MLDTVSDFICIYDGIWFAVFRGKFYTYLHVKSSFLFGELIIQYFIYNVSHLDVSGEKTCVRCVKEYTKVCGLKYQDGNYDLVKLQDKEYKDKLQVQIDYCTELNGNEDGKAK